MGKRGPKKTDTKTLLRRGSSLGVRRAKDSAAKKNGKNSPDGKVKKPPFRMSTARVELCCRTLVPGYDPWSGAGAYRFDVAKARAAVKWFHDELVHVKGGKAGQPFKLEPWQVAWLGNLFGWFDRKTGLRRYRQCLGYVPRKNGKTPIVAGLVLITLFTDREPGAEIYGAASEYKQASLAFVHAAAMVSRNERLSSRAQTFKGQQKAIQLTPHVDNIDEISLYRVIAADSLTAHGFNTHVAAVDELHTQPNRDLVDALETSISGRDNPLLVYITTADFERDGSVCNEKHDYACGVRDGTINDLTFLPVLYFATRDDAFGTFVGKCPIDGKTKDLPNWANPKLWARVNPNLGVSKHVEYMREQVKKAMQVPSYLNTFLRLDLNVRTEQDTRAIAIDQWDACDGPVEPKPGQLCYAGLDLASRNDLAAWVLMFPPAKEGGKWLILPRMYCPKDRARERESKDRAGYLAWGREGFLTLTDGGTIDYSVIKADIEADGKMYNIAKIAADRWNLEHLRQELSLEGVEIYEFGQGFQSMSEPTKELLYNLLPSGRLAHAGHPVLRWMASNVALREDPAGNIKFDKEKSGDKIDGLVGVVMGLGVALVDKKPARPYQKRGVRFV